MDARRRNVKRSLDDGCVEKTNPHWYVRFGLKKIKINSLIYTKKLIGYTNKLCTRRVQNGMFFDQPCLVYVEKKKQNFYTWYIAMEDACLVVLRKCYCVYSCADNVHLQKIIDFCFYGCYARHPSVEPSSLPKTACAVYRKRAQTDFALYFVQVRGVRPDQSGGLPGGFSMGHCP